MAVERAGIPAVVNICEGFRLQAGNLSAMGGMPWLPLVHYPGHIDTYSLEQRETYISELVAPGNDEALTTQIEAAAGAAVEPPETTIAFKGTLEEVLEYYHEKMWSDGLPIIPPTKEKVEEFLKYTDYPADAVITPPIEPSYREATPWTVAVNGVMAGCRPEYMPVLMAMVNVIADPVFHAKDSSSTPGWEPITILSGPVAKQLGFNYAAGVMNAGFQANSSVGRFWKLFQRNVLEIRVQTVDKGTFARNWQNIIAEDTDECARIGWNPLSVQAGFKQEDTTVTMMSWTGRISDPSMIVQSAEDQLAGMVPYIARCFTPYHMTNPLSSYFIALTPLLAELVASGGYSKEDAVQYFFENVKVPAHMIDQNLGSMRGVGKSSLAIACAEGQLDPDRFCASDDPNRMVPLFQSVDQIFLIVTGDPARNRYVVIETNVQAGQGVQTTKKVELPKDWDALMAESELPKLIEKSGLDYY